MTWIRMNIDTLLWEQTQNAMVYRYGKISNEKALLLMFQEFIQTTKIIRSLENKSKKVEEIKKVLFPMIEKDISDHPHK